MATRHGQFHFEGRKVALAIWTTLVTTLMLCALASAEEPAGFYDRAEVLNVEPLRHQTVEPVRREVCEELERDIFEEPALPAGDIRVAEPGLSLAEAIRADLRSYEDHKPASPCRWETHYRTHEGISGYRVTYRYEGETYTQQMAEDPGEFVKVHIELQPE